MKTFCLILIWGAYLMAQDAKVAAAVEAPAVAVLPERPLTELEITKIQLADARIELLKKSYKIDEYSKEVQPLVSEKEAVLIAACVSIGIPAEKVRTECGANTGGAGPDGKPVAGRVWTIKPEKDKK